MTISKELFLAVLAMDSYNRGYDAGITDEPKGDTNGLGEGGSSIGGANVLNTPLPPDSASIGFYAVAYDTPYGKVISYRGTDGPNDIWNGWTFGAGARQRPLAPAPSDTRTLS
jgi:hypothetical protein